MSYLVSPLLPIFSIVSGGKAGIEKIQSYYPIVDNEKSWEKKGDFIMALSSITLKVQVGDLESNIRLPWAITLLERTTLIKFVEQARERGASGLPKKHLEDAITLELDGKPAKWSDVALKKHEGKVLKVTIK